MSEKIVSNDGRILHVVSGDLGDANTSYTYFNLGAESYNMFTLHFTIVATTLSIQASNDSCNTADTSKTWVDVTNALTGSATTTATGGWIVDTPCSFSRIRITRLTTSATNALDLFLTRYQA